MPTNVNIPALGDSVSEAVLIKWLKNDGDTVAAAEPLAELETDKANVDLPSPVAGVFKRGVKEGTTVKIGQTIASVDELAKGAAPAAAVASAAGSAVSSAANGASSGAKVASAGATAVAEKTLNDLAPAPRRIAAEAGLAPSAIPATGPRGNVTKQDAASAAAVAAAPVAAPAPAAKMPAPAAPIKPQVPASHAGLGTATGDDLPFDANGSKRVPMSKIRKKIAERLVSAQHTAAILTTFNEVDLTEVMVLRAKHKDRFEKSHGIGLGFMSFFAKATVAALKTFPRVNGQIDGDNVVYFNHVHLGIAVSTERGLVVPVLKNAHALSFAQIELEIKRLAIAARDGKLGMDEMSGGTFTITNGGVFGSLLSTPIINPPQSGILGMHTIQKRPVVVNDQIVIRSMMYTALSYDHRLVDGKDSVSFLVKVKELLEDPSRLLLDL